MWKTVLMVVAVLTAGATSSFAWVNLEATCAGGQAQIYLRIGNTYGPEFVGVVVTRYQMGSCEVPAIVTESPIALPPTSGWLDFSVPAPLTGVFYRFEAQLIDGDGDLHPIADEWVQGLPQQPRDYASDGEAVLIRGALSLPYYPGSFAVFISPCADGCWGDLTESYLLTESPDFSEPLIWFAFAGSVVDIVGTFNEPEGMPGSPVDIFVENAQLAPAGSCGVVNTETQTWGALKVQFR